MSAAERLTILSSVGSDLLARLHTYRLQLAAIDTLTDLHVSEKVAKRLLEKFPEDTLKENDKGYDLLTQSANSILAQWKGYYELIGNIGKFKDPVRVLLKDVRCLTLR